MEQNTSKNVKSETVSEKESIISSSKKYSENPFLKHDVFAIERGQKTIIAGSTKKILLDAESGEMEAIAVLHKYKEVDKEKFVKLYLGEITSLFDLSKCGLKIFAFFANQLRLKNDEVYLYFPDIMSYTKYKSRRPIYKGLTELIKSGIIAMSTRPNIFYINPKILFNGDRIAFIKEYRLKEEKKVKQIEIPYDKEIQSNSEGK